MQTLSADDRAFRIEYIVILHRALKKAADGGFDVSDVKPEDIPAIVYWLKDCAERPVNQTYSEEQCLEAFKARIDDLAALKVNEWTRLTELSGKNLNDLPNGFAVEIASLQRSFHRKSRELSA